MPKPSGAVSRSSVFGGSVEQAAALCYNAVNKQGMAREAEDMGGIGAPELLIVLAIVIIIFGVGRIGKVGKELGTGIREFRKGVTGDEEKPAAQDDKPTS